VSSNELQSLLAPSSMAVIGASSDPKRMSGMIVTQARRFGFEGDIYPINPRYEELAGFRCYPSILELRDTPPDAAVIYLKAEAALQAAAECAEIGVKSLIVLSAGFSEVGDEGVALQERLVEICRDAGMSACGPNTAGLANFNVGFVAYGSSGFSGLAEVGGGDVAIISSSGGLGSTLLSYCRQRGLGVSHLIGIGNEAVTTAADYLDALVDDPQVGCVIALLESIRDAETFFAAADRALAAGKQVIVMKQGRSDVGMRSIQTHTAAMGGSAADFEAACRAHGIIVVRELHSLADQALLATKLGPTAGYDIGVLSLPGGGTSLLADAASEQGFQLPPLSDAVGDALRPILPDIATVGNPLDPTAGFGRDKAKLQEAVELFASEPAFDLVFFFQSASEPEYCADIARVLVKAKESMGKPLACVWEAGPDLEEGAWAILREAGIPLFVSATDAFTSLARHRRFTELAERSRDRGPDDFGPLHAGGFSAPERSDDTSVDWASALLEDIGVRRPGAEVVSTVEEAVAAADRIGYPVVMKLESSTVSHKSDVGGVRLGVANADEVREAFAAIHQAVTAAVGADAIEGILVQETIPSGVELLLGVHTDEQVGPLVTVGFGGTLTELFSDISRRPVPVTRQDVLDMIGELKIAPLLTGYRGSAPADVDGFVELVQRVAWAAHEMRSSTPEFELNPVIVGAIGSRPVAVDWVVR
jgi:acyl-CoA synthetase (NDP forming)